MAYRGIFIVLAGLWYQIYSIGRAGGENPVYKISRGMFAKRLPHVTTRCNTLKFNGLERGNLIVVSFWRLPHTTVSFVFNAILIGAYYTIM